MRNLHQRKVRFRSTQKDKDRVILTADKGSTMVVMDREDYITKVEALLSQPAYRFSTQGPYNQIKASSSPNVGESKRTTI